MMAFDGIFLLFLTLLVSACLLGSPHQILQLFQFLVFSIFNIFTGYPALRDLSSAGSDRWPSNVLLFIVRLHQKGQEGKPIVIKLIVKHWDFDGIFLLFLMGS